MNHGTFTTSAASLRRVVALALFVAAVTACGGSRASSPPEIRLVPDADGGAVIAVTNLPDDVAETLAARELTREQWAEILSVSVEAGQPAMLGTYALSGNSLRFTPMFPLDPGRQ